MHHNLQGIIVSYCRPLLAWDLLWKVAVLTYPVSFMCSAGKVALKNQWHLVVHLNNLLSLFSAIVKY